MGEKYRRMEYVDRKTEQLHNFFDKLMMKLTSATFRQRMQMRFGETIENYVTVEYDRGASKVVFTLHPEIMNVYQMQLVRDAVRGYVEEQRLLQFDTTGEVMNRWEVTPKV